MASTVYEFHEFLLDCGRFELSRNGRSVSVERKPMELLILLAERNGQLVTRAEIADRLWEREVFVDTEHGINTAIRKVRQTLRDDSEEPRFVQTVMGKGYRFVAPVAVRGGEGNAAARPDAGAGLDESRTVAATEPASISSEAAGPEEAENRGSLRWLVWAIPGVLLMAVGVATVARGARSWTHRQSAQAGIRSLAVLPLDNLSGDPEQEYFADGMTDELTTMLAKDSTLRIVSRTSVMQYKRARRPLPEIARALGVDGILEGSVARSSDHVHLTLQLIQADTDSHLWAESYDRDANDVALPNEAAQAIARQLHRSAPAVAKAQYVNPQAHDAYLRGEYLWFGNRLGESGEYFRKATEIQPDYAQAWAGLSNYYGGAAAERILDPRTSLEPEDEAATRALQLDPTLAEAHQAMAAAFFFHRWDWAGADRELLRAISLNPQSAELYHLRAKLLNALNRDTEAIASEKQAMEINPFERPWALVLTYATARQFDAALADGQLRQKTYPADTNLLYVMTETYRRKGMHREAVEGWARLHVATGDPQPAVDLRRAYQEGGFRGFVRWELARRTEQAKSRYVSPVELALYHAELEEREPTLALLEEGYEQHAPDLLWIQTDPAYDFLHNDPRYRSLIQKIGLPPTY